MWDKALLVSCVGQGVASPLCGDKALLVRCVGQGVACQFTVEGWDENSIPDPRSSISDPRSPIPDPRSTDFCKFTAFTRKDKKLFWFLTINFYICGIFQSDCL